MNFIITSSEIKKALTPFDDRAFRLKFLIQPMNIKSRRMIVNGERPFLLRISKT